MRTHPLALATLVAFALSASLAAGASPAGAAKGTAGVELARVAGAVRTARQRPRASGDTAPTRTAPSSPPLTTGEAGEGSGGGEEGSAGAPQTEADPLVSNGLGSPTCRGVFAGELSAAARHDCETSGFVASPAPTGNYGIDVHINTGLFGLGTGAGLNVVQDLIVTPLWMALVWAVHALVVMLEWCFTIDLLDSSAAAGIGSGLRRMQAAVTEPWLPIALACASVLALYHGLVRRRVAETLGEALLMGVMMVGGIWVIANPTGTVGALGVWANRASVGTLAAAASGAPSSPGRALASSLGSLFATTIEMPWCYLEFGDVGWCREPSRLDPNLHKAALGIASEELAQTACRPDTAALADCTPVGSAQARALDHSAELLRDARSNGAIFLALPANGPARNSINEQGSLLRTLCQSSEATNCHGSTAAQAEFRTNGGTWSRFGGLLLIAGGLLGMMLLLGFVAMRLLAAAIFSLLYLLVTPAMVLAPAFGTTGRTLFRRWATQLLGAVVSKLVFSFLLGVVFAVFALLSNLATLGWWTQWLLISAFWWGAYTRRHQVLGVAERGLGHEGPERRSLVRRASDLLESRKGMAVARWARAKRSSSSSGTEPQRRRKLAQAGRERAGAAVNEQVTRTLEHEFRDAHERAGAAPQIQRELWSKRARLERLERERAQAQAGGDTRRSARLELRAERVRGEIDREQQSLNAAQRTAREGEHAQRKTGASHTREHRDARERFLDEQAALPAAAQARRAGERRDYAALAGLAGYGRAEYERLDPRGQRAARLEIDRELALRREVGETAKSLAVGTDTATLGRRERLKADRSFDGALQRRMRERGHSLPASRRPRSAVELWREAGRAESRSTSDRPRPGDPAAEQSSVMRDAREVAARRKRQLGTDRP